MSSSHNHSRKNIGFALGLNASFTLIEFIGGYLTGSVAIIADAFHDLGDTLTLVISYFMEKKSERRPSEAYSYGYQRYSVLGALISGLILVSGSAIVVWEAFPLIFSPKENHPGGMMAVALLGIVANGLAFFRLHHGHSENEKMIKWHLFEDLAGWVAVLIASVVMYFYHVPWLDPLLAVFIALFIAYNVFRNMRRVIGIFLQKAPADFNTVEFINKVKGLDLVYDAHDVHCWTLDGTQHVISCHLVLPDEADQEVVKEKVRALDPWQESHFTIEIERKGAECNHSCD